MSADRTVTYDWSDAPATRGNNRRVHLVREARTDSNLTMCGVVTPRRPQTTQEPLPKCRRCFGSAA